MDILLAQAIRHGLRELANRPAEELLARHEKLQDLRAQILGGAEFTVDGADAFQQFSDLIFGPGR